MAKTRGESSNAATKERKTSASFSRSQALQNFNHTRFNSRDNQQWHKALKNKKFIKEKNIAPNVEEYFHVQE